MYWRFHNFLFPHCSLVWNMILSGYFWDSISSRRERNFLLRVLLLKLLEQLILVWIEISRRTSLHLITFIFQVLYSELVKIRSLHVLLKLVWKRRVMDVFKVDSKLSQNGYHLDDRNLIPDVDVPNFPWDIKTVKPRWDVKDEKYNHDLLVLFWKNLVVMSPIPEHEK